ncbi:MAG: recombinase family protein [Clostridiales Family XIII bacterium]|jgi:DNA invertase Pin-like site-specific DNA recombinase|nr:recombinase family protein [Clostridiales Family XIII bacterium]
MARKSRKNKQPEAAAVKAAVYASTGYARISVDGEKSEDSIENQAALIRDYVRDKPDLDLKDVITTDTGYTGTDFDRPGYTELMAGILDGSTRCVIVKDLSRLGRTYIEVGELLFDTFPAYDVRFISVNDYYDSFADDAGRKKLVILFKNLVNHVYSKDLGNKIRSVKALKRKNGKRGGGLPLYGYAPSEDGQSYVIDKETAEIVRLIFNMRREGYGTLKIANHLNATGTLSPSNYYYNKGMAKAERFAKKIRWRYPQVYRILTEEQYTGRLIQGKTNVRGKEVTEMPREDWITHENAFPAIIDSATFGEVRDIILRDNGQRKGRQSSPERASAWDENILVGKMYCSRCGKAAPRLENRRKGALTYSYLCYYCNAELKGAGVKAGNFTTPFTKIETAVTAAIRTLVTAFAEFDGPAAANTGGSALAEKRRISERERDKYVREREHAEKLLSAAYTHHLQGVLDSNEFEIARRRFEQDGASATANLKRAESALREFDKTAARRNAALLNARKYCGFETLTKEIVTVFVRRIEISPGSDEIAITLNFTDCLDDMGIRTEESGVAVNA